MKHKSTTFLSWDADTYNDGNSSGFSGLPAGYRSYGGGFFDRGDYAHFWEASEDDASSANYRLLDGRGVFLTAFSYGKAGGFSVRCLRD